MVRGLVKLDYTYSFHHVLRISTHVEPCGSSAVKLQPLRGSTDSTSLSWAPIFRHAHDQAPVDRQVVTDQQSQHQAPRGAAVVGVWAPVTTNI